MKFLPLIATIGLLLLSSCSKPQPAADNYRYERVDRMAGKYADILLAVDPTSVATQRRLMDIAFRTELLNQQGDSSLALFFRVAIEEKVKAANPELAETLFGGPTSVFFDEF